MTGRTRHGFCFDVAPAVMDNMELLDALAAANDNDPLAISRVCVMILGEEQRKRLYDHLRTEDGRVPLADVSAALEDIMASFGTVGKN